MNKKQIGNEALAYLKLIATSLEAHISGGYALTKNERVYAYLVGKAKPMSLQRLVKLI